MSESKPVAGVDLGGTKIHALIVTVDGEVLGEDRRPTLAAQGADIVIERIVASVRSALEEAKLDTSALAGVGISTPGPCDPARGIVTNAPNLPGFVDLPLAQRVGKALGVPAILENDAAAACYGEYRYGAGRGYEHIVYVTLGTGIGGGIIIDGRLYSGASGGAGEVGHVVVDDRAVDCNCGSRGCVETLASGRAIARDAAAALAAGQCPALAELVAGGEPTAELVLEAAQRGDDVSRKVLERAGYYLGLGLAGLLNCFNPQALILGGGLLGLGDLYLGPALRTARERAFEQIVADVTFTNASLPDRAGALGAAALLIERTRR